MMCGVKTMSSLQKDFVASHLRSQLANLHNILEIVENSDMPEDSYIEESLTMVEKELRRVRNFYMNN